MVRLRTQGAELTATERIRADRECQCTNLILFGHIVLALVDRLVLEEQLLGFTHS